MSIFTNSKQLPSQCLVFVLEFELIRYKYYFSPSPYRSLNEVGITRQRTSSLIPMYYNA